MDEPNSISVEVDDTPLDTLTIRLWRDGGYNGKPCPPDAPWMAVMGPNLIEGVAGSGITQSAAILDLCTRILLRGGNVQTDTGVLAIHKDPVADV